MMRYRVAFAALLVVAGCGGNPFLDEDAAPVVPVDPETGEEIATPLANGVLAYDDVRGKVNGVTFASTPNGPISLNIDAQDAVTLEGTYTRDASLDVGKYKAYSYQDTGSNRKVVALVSDELDSARAVLAVDGGQFANYHGGGVYTRAEAFTQPVATNDRLRAFNYSGTYVGMVNFGTPTPGGPGGSLNPTQAFRTEGRILVTANFAEMSVSGGIDGRRIIDIDFALADQMMDLGRIDAAGNFTGTMKRRDVDETTGAGRLTDSGSYAGIFAGPNASEIAALYVFQPIQGNPDAEERGMFTSDNCVIENGPACRR